MHISFIVTALLKSFYLGISFFLAHLSEEYGLTAKEILSLIKNTHNILSEHLLAVSQLAHRICVLGACKQKLCEPAKMMPLTAKRRGTWSPITSSKQYKIMLNNSWFLDLIKMKGWIGAATSEFSVSGRSLQQKARSGGRNFEIILLLLEDRDPKNIWPCSLCWTCSRSCFLLVVPKWQWHTRLSHGGKKLDFKAADYESYQKNPTTLYLRRKEIQFSIYSHGGGEGGRQV